jgi:hypothetical protein
MIEELKMMVSDKRLHIYIGLVKKLYLAQDRSYLKVMVEVLPERRQIIATMTWDAVGPNSGEFAFPMINDLVLCANAEGDDDRAYIVKRLTSKEDTIPTQAVGGDKVSSALSGKKYWNVSDTKLLLARGESEPSENLVLGQVFKSFAESLLDVLKDHAQANAVHKHIGNLGYQTTPPDNASDHLIAKADYGTLKSSPIGDESILSDLSFTEK